MTPTSNSPYTSSSVTHGDQLQPSTSLKASIVSPPDFGSVVTTNKDASLVRAIVSHVSNLKNTDVEDGDQSTKKNGPLIQILACPTGDIPDDIVLENAILPPDQHAYLQDSFHYCTFIYKAAFTILKDNNRFSNQRLMEEMARYFSNVSVLAYNDADNLDVSMVKAKLGPDKNAVQYVFLVPGKGIALPRQIDTVPLPQVVKDLLKRAPFIAVDITQLRHRFNSTMKHSKGPVSLDKIVLTTANIVPLGLSFLVIRRDPSNALLYDYTLYWTLSLTQLSRSKDLVCKSVVSWKSRQPHLAKTFNTIEILRHNQHDKIPSAQAKREIYLRPGHLDLCNFGDIDFSSLLVPNPGVTYSNFFFIPRVWLADSEEITRSLRDYFCLDSNPHDYFLNLL